MIGNTMTQPASGTGKLVVVTGPSGVGKSTIVREVLRRTGVKFSVSATTRAPREGEVNGREYFFVSPDEFRRMIAGDELLEHAEVFGQMYGTPARPVRDAVAGGQTLLLDIDVQGGLQVSKTMPSARFVLILPPSKQELERRLRGRGGDSEESIGKRLAKSQQEIDTALHSGVYNYQIVNDDLERAIQQVVRIVKE
jgi:guanylate kinase